MIILGLTGSIGMGKTTAARMLAKMGCGVHDSDAAVRQALSPGGDAFEEVALTFPEAWDKKKHIIKRDILGDIVFNDVDKRRVLEDILHPMVQRSQKKFAQAQERLGRDIVALDIPLLFETGAQTRMDYTAVVSAPYHIQRRRVLSRPGMNEEKFQAILNTQMLDREKRALADFVVQTGMGMAYTYRELEKIVRDIL